MITDDELNDCVSNFDTLDRDDVCQLIDEIKNLRLNNEKLTKALAGLYECVSDVEVRVPDRLCHHVMNAAVALFELPFKKGCP